MTIHWIVPIIASVIFGASIVGLFLGIMVSQTSYNRPPCACIWDNTDICLVVLGRYLYHILGFSPSREYSPSIHHWCGPPPVRRENVRYSRCQLGRILDRIHRPRLCPCSNVRPPFLSTDHPPSHQHADFDPASSGSTVPGSEEVVDSPVRPMTLDVHLPPRLKRAGAWQVKSPRSARN